MAHFKVNEVHWDVFIAFMEKYPDFASGRLNCSTGRDKYRQLWEELTCELNSLGYGEKPIEKWQKTWSDYKCTLKKKAADIRRSQSQTGGRPEFEKKLTCQEERF